MWDMGLHYGTNPNAQSQPTRARGTAKKEAESCKGTLAHADMPPRLVRRVWVSARRMTLLGRAEIGPGRV